MLEDIFNKVKKRMADSQPPEAAGSVEIPSNILFKCPRCRSVVFQEEFEKNMKICPKCGYHARITARERLSITADAGTFVEYDAAMRPKNPIHFPDYAEKIKRLQQATGLNDAILTGECSINGQKTCIGVMDSNFMMASMGSVVGEKITRLFESAAEKRLPVVLFTASGGARMQEGIVSLMQMAKTSGAAARHSDKGLLYITVLTDPTTGGVTASFASLGDIILAEPKVLVGFTGRRVIEGTIHQRLPDEFQSAEFLLEHGFVDKIVGRPEMKDVLSRLIAYHAEEGCACAPHGNESK